MKISTDKNKINELLTRGVENVYPNKEFLEKRLKEGKQLSLYIGIDPTDLPKSQYLVDRNFE